MACASPSDACAPLNVWARKYTADRVVHPVGPPVDANLFQLVRAWFALAQSSGALPVRPAIRTRNDGTTFDTPVAIGSDTRNNDGITYGTVAVSHTSTTNGEQLVQPGVERTASSSAPTATRRIVSRSAPVALSSNAPPRVVQGGVLRKRWAERHGEVRVLAGGRSVTVAEDGRFECTVDRPTAVAAFVLSSDGRLAFGDGEIVEPKAGRQRRHLELKGPDRRDLAALREQAAPCLRSVATLEANPGGFSEETRAVMMAACKEVCERELAQANAR